MSIKLLVPLLQAAKSIRQQENVELINLINSLASSVSNDHSCFNIL